MLDLTLDQQQSLVYFLCVGFIHANAVAVIFLFVPSVYYQSLVMSYFDIELTDATLEGGTVVCFSSSID
jgi:hypothetical protein